MLQSCCTLTMTAQHSAEGRPARTWAGCFSKAAPRASRSPGDIYRTGAHPFLLIVSPAKTAGHRQSLITTIARPLRLKYVGASVDRDLTCATAAAKRFAWLPADPQYSPGSSSKPGAHSRGRMDDTAAPGVHRQSKPARRVKPPPGTEIFFAPQACAPRAIWDCDAGAATAEVQVAVPHVPTESGLMLIVRPTVVISSCSQMLSTTSNMTSAGTCSQIAQLPRFALSHQFLRCSPSGER